MDKIKSPSHPKNLENFLPDIFEQFGRILLSQQKLLDEFKDSQQKLRDEFQDSQQKIRDEFKDSQQKVLDVMISLTKKVESMELLVQEVAGKPTFTYDMTTDSQNKVGVPVLSTTSKPAAPEIHVPKTEENHSAPGVNYIELAAKANMWSVDKPMENPFSLVKGFGSPFSVTPVSATVSSSTATTASQKSSSSSSTAAAHKDEQEDDFVPTAEFTPVIPLPPLAEVIKGDENETALFQHRAKLLRFVKETKEWKVRGVGDIRILQAKDNPRKIRVLMWREGVHKIVCNHWVTKEITVTTHQENPKALKWHAIDFADGEEQKPETFVCQFDQEDTAIEFKKQMDYAISLVEKTPVAPQKGEEAANKVEEASKEDAAPAANGPLSELFKKPEGTWSCSSCYTDNKKEGTVCAACTTPNPDASRVTKADAPPDAGVQKSESLKLPELLFSSD